MLVYKITLRLVTREKLFYNVTVLTSLIQKTWKKCQLILINVIAVLVTSVSGGEKSCYMAGIPHFL